MSPYLSEVYFGLLERQTRKNYLGIKRTKQYLNLPELIGERVVKLINANGDERIDHDEFVAFFMKALMGTFEQKMYIAFRIYDIDNDQIISEKEVKLVLKGIPIVVEERYGISHSID